MKRFLLINPWIADFAAYDFWVKPVGLLCLAELLRQSGPEVILLDCLDRHDPGWLQWLGRSAARERWDGTGKFHREPIPKPPLLGDVPRRYCRYGWSVEYFRARLAGLARPDAVLVTSHMTYWYPGVQEAVREVRRRWPGVPVILGGIYATLCREHAAKHSAADLVVGAPLTGDSLRALWEWLGLTESPPDDWFPSLERLPYDLYPNLRSAAILTGLGCPFRCTFCASYLLHPVFVRREPAAVAREIAHLHKARGVLHFAFFDDALLLGATRHFLRLCEEILLQGVRAYFHTPNGLHVREVSREVAEAMAATGFRTIRLSYETSNPQRQQEMAAKVSDGDLAAALDHLEQAGYSRSEIGVYVLGGLPGQELAEVIDSLLTVAGLGARSSLAIFSPIPGTREFAKAVEMGLLPANPDPLLTNDTRVPLRSEQFNPATVQKLRHLVKWLNQQVERRNFRFPDRDALVHWVLDPGARTMPTGGQEAVDWVGSDRSLSP
ncbi:MAG: cobalamin-dependent protein [candidate division KSB1 bacterium]|nr:cobalamin-dependent protein [candidate division KSB1 bacterium]